jgi:hypothetical protein
MHEKTFNILFLKNVPKYVKICEKNNKNELAKLWNGFIAHL